MVVFHLGQILRERCALSAVETATAERRLASLDNRMLKYFIGCQIYETKVAIPYESPREDNDKGVLDLRK